MIKAFIQNTPTVTVQQSSPTVFGRARRGWCYDGPTYGARRLVAAKSYRPIADLGGIPGDMICVRRLPHEHLAAFNKDIIPAELSGDEQHVDVPTQASVVQAGRLYRLCFRREYALSL